MKRLVLIAALLGLSAIAFAEGEGGSTAEDGGHGVVCVRPSSQAPRERDVTVQTLDLFEARSIYGKKYWRENFLIPHHVNNDTLLVACHLLKEKQIETGRFVYLDGKLRTAFRRACKVASVARIGTQLMFTSDVGQLRAHVPNYCKLNQLAVYKTSGHKISVSIDERFVRHFSELELAALLLHEALHADFPRGSTAAIRQFVMYAMSNRRFKERNPGAAQLVANCRCSVNPNLFARP